uniref:Uncharacterized protein n=1 Tax=Arundo donax TaxID=35708 RepID=A0A0A9H5Q5_ARUDO
MGFGSGGSANLGGRGGDEREAKEREPDTDQLQQ